MSDDDYTEIERQRRARLKLLAMFGLVVVGGLLFYKCALQADRIGLGTGSPAKATTPDLEIMLARDGSVMTRGCQRSTVEDCLAVAKLHVRDGDGSASVRIHVEAGTSPELSRQLQALVTSFELTPVVD